MLYIIQFENRAKVPAAIATTAPITRVSKPKSKFDDSKGKEENKSDNKKPIKALPIIENILICKTEDKQDIEPLEGEEFKDEFGLTERIYKETSVNLKKYLQSPTSIDDVFLSNNAQKQKREIRKMAYEKRLQYGQMIQKQVLKMHKKKT